VGSLEGLYVMAATASKVELNEQLIGIYKIRPWQRGRTYIVTVPKEIVKLLQIKGGEKVRVCVSTRTRRIVYEVVD